MRLRWKMLVVFALAFGVSFGVTSLAFYGVKRSKEKVESGERAATVNDVESLIKSYCPTAGEIHRVFQEECWGVRYDRENEKHTEE